MHARRLAIFCRSLAGGGAERVMTTVANGLAEKGHDVFLCLTRGSGPYLREVSRDVRIVDLACRTPAFALVPFARFLERERPSAVLSTLVAENTMAVAASRLVSKRSRPRVVVREANTLSVALRFRSRANRLVAGAVARAVYPRADAIVAVSTEAKHDLVRFLGVDEARVHAIPNPAMTRDVAARTAVPIDDPWLERTSDTPNAPPLVVAAGRLVPKKGFDVLIDAFSRIRSDARLAILGDGPERTLLDRQIDRLALRGRVKLVGFVDEPFAWFARADLFVLSSLAEGMPNVLLQAMACGCPVVATDCPSGPREILEDGRWGRLVPPESAEALSNAIDEALRAKDHADVRARAAAFADDVIVAAYERVLCT